MYSRSVTVLIAVWAFLLGLMLLQPGCVQAMERRQITFDVVRDEARSLSRNGYRQADAPLPDVFREMDYDDYRNIRFRPDKALWLADQLPFHLQFFHRGYLFEDPVRISEFTETHVQELPYVNEFFRFDDMDIQSVPRRNSGYAGWRLHAPINTPLYYDEVLAFLGASYFRAVGKGQKYGLSARAIQIPDQPPTPEEFPTFTQFWIRKPAPEDPSLTAFGLLDGPSISGAYKFVITPGDPTVVEVTASLFPRRDLASIGLGTLTSMFYFGENTYPKPDDFRPEVHDSDGLFLEYASGSRHWRPLDVGPVERVSRFEGTQLTAFGLSQRDRSYSSYLDSEGLYHQRPSALVRLTEGFQAGEVLLRELPPQKEFFDNIVVSFIPTSPLSAGTEYTYRYTLEWGSFSPPQHLGEVLLTRHGRDIHDPSKEVFLIEYTIPSGVDPASLTLVARTSENARIDQQYLDRDPGSSRCRVNLQVIPQSGGPIELSVSLKSGSETVSEKWLYRWNPYN